MKQPSVPVVVFAVLVLYAVIVNGKENPETAGMARREPFYHLYEKNTNEAITLEGTVNMVSAVPVPSKNDYDDCLYSVFVELESFKLDHSSKKSPPPKEIIVNVPILKDKNIIKDNLLFPGDKVLITAVEYDAMPTEIQQIQLSDDIQSFEHQYYFAKTLKKIASFSAGRNSNFSTREITILPIQTLPKDETAARKRHERIQKEILRIEEEIKKHGGSFAAWKKEYEPIGDRYRQLYKEGVKGWIGNSFFAAGLETLQYNTKIFISEVLPFKKYLEERNIDLIVVRIPYKGDFAARVYASDDFQENPEWIEHYYECLKNDIEIVDPMYEMWKERFDHPLFYFFHVPREEHPFEGMYLPMAKFLSKVLSRYSYVKDDKITLRDGGTFDSRVMQDERRYYPEGNELFCENGNLRELTFKYILQNNERVGRLKTYGGSPFICLSSSWFGLTWLQDQGASLPHYLCYYLRHMVDWKYQSGMGNNMLRILLSDRNALNKRKAVIMQGNWCGGFSSIPKYLVDNAQKLVLMETIGVDSLLKQNNGTFESKVQYGMSMFSAKQDKIRFDIEIPPMPNFKTCMIRINIPGSLSRILVSVVDSNGRELDSSYFTLAIRQDNTRSDLFVPAPEKKQKVSVVIVPPGAGSYYFGIKNIELWGF